ncbi:MAG: adenylate kinase [Chlamydiota bacterium]
MNKENRRTVILLGPPLSGKGTQAARLSEEFDLTHISSGDLFRQHIKDQTPLGIEAQRYIDQGKLVPDDLVIDMVFEKIEESSKSNGTLLDGFPRTIEQAEAFQQRLDKNANLTVILLKADDEAIIERGSSRLTCTNTSCGRTYSSKTMPPKVDMICDECGSPVEVRHDDRPEVIRQRLEVYHEQTNPLVDYYSERGVLYTVDATQAPDEVYQKVLEALNQ